MKRAILGLVSSGIGRIARLVLGRIGSPQQCASFRQREAYGTPRAEDVLSLANSRAREIMCPSVRPIERGMREPRMDPQSTVFPAQPCRP